MADGPGTARDAAEHWLGPGVAGIGGASLLADLAHEIPTALLSSLLVGTLHAPASALGLIEGISDAAAGLARLGGGALADYPHRRRAVAVGGYTTTAILSAGIGAVVAPWQAGLLRASAWAARVFESRPAMPCWPISFPRLCTGGPTASSGRWTTCYRWPASGHRPPRSSRHPMGDRPVGHSPRAPSPEDSGAPSHPWRPSFAWPLHLQRPSR